MAAAEAIDYAKLQDIREESGRQHVKYLEALTGTANGSNTEFYTSRKYIVDRDYDDDLDDDDVVVYVNSVAVAVTSVDAVTGKIVLTAAPASNATVKADYAFSALNDTKVGQYRDEAIGFVQSKLSGIIDYESWEAADVPDEIKTIVRMYASGLILIRDYGSSADTDLTSKDGYKRLQWAKSALAEYITAISDNSGSSSPVTISGASDGNIFYRETDLSNEYEGSANKDEHFMQED